jgi:hypothetical protein
MHDESAQSLSGVDLSSVVGGGESNPFNLHVVPPTGENPIEHSFAVPMREGAENVWWRKRRPWAAS